MSSVSSNDLTLVISIEPYYIRMYYVFYIIKNILFWTILTLLLRKSASIIEEYRYYLCINMISSYIFGSILFIWQSIIIMPETYVCGLGPLVMNKTVNYILIFISLSSSLVIHMFGIMLCLLYQLANAELGFLLKVFETKKLPTIGFLVVSFTSCLICNIMVYVATSDMKENNIDGNILLLEYLSE